MSGCWRRTRAARSIRRAIEAGINFFDTADMYSLGVSEEIPGRALKEFGPSRDRVVIATKVFNAMGDDPNQRGLSRKHILHAHRRQPAPSAAPTTWTSTRSTVSTPQTPIEETLEALDDVVRAGKALYIGASSMFAWQFPKMLHDLRRDRAEPASSPCRTTTTWSTAKKSGR